MDLVSQPAVRLRTVTYLFTALGALAWGLPLALIMFLFSGADESVFATLVKASTPTPHARLGLLAIGLLVSLLAPLFLRRLGRARWALAIAAASIAAAFLAIYLPAILASPAAH